MSCGDWEERIALYAGGDLAGESAAEVERHLAECAGCRETAASYGWGMELLRQAHAEPIEQAHYTAVRARVLAEIERVRRPVWRRAWVWSLAAVAAAAILVVMLPRPVGRPSRAAFRESAAANPPEITGLVYGPAAPVRVQRAKTREKRQGRPADQPRLEAVTIKLLTDDPNVIIYWIADGTGE